MTCSADVSTVAKTENWLFENWARTQRVLVPMVYDPKSVDEIVAAVLHVEGRRESVKAIGSQWAYGGVAVDDSTQNVINTQKLVNKLNDDDPTKAIIPFALLDTLKQSAKYYVHVEAGIPIWQLNCMLDGMGLAMPTLGGNNGQSLAGAIATGSHGTDVDAAPIADAVRAIHLVGPGGKEWWIERDEGAGAITDPARMAQAQTSGRLCSDARVAYDTSLFRSVLVTMGRMGVAYSYVLLAVDSFHLTAKRGPSTWTAERANLRALPSPGTPNAFGATPGGVPWRWLEIFVNPYPDATGEHTCIVTRKSVATAAADPDDAGPTDFGNRTLEWFCKTDDMTAILVALNLELPALLAWVNATATATLTPLNAIPVAGPVIFAVAMAAVLHPIAALQLELASLLAESPTGNFAEQLANVINQAVQVPAVGVSGGPAFPGGKALIPAIVSSQADAIRPPSEDGKTRASYVSYTGQASCPAPGVSWTRPTLGRTASGR